MIQRIWLEGRVMSGVKKKRNQENSKVWDLSNYTEHYLTKQTNKTTLVFIFSNLHLF